MNELLIFVKLFLVLGGIVLVMVGAMWYRVAHLLHFFEIEIDPDKGFKVMLIGAGMLMAGFGWMYLER
jgi:hypothetical protein